MRILVQISRIIVGCLFIFSGFIKANDTIGFGYKLDEYFHVFGMEWLSGLSWFLATFMCVLEMALGFMLLMGTKIKFTLWMLFLLCVFFGFLTFYSAYFDAVKSCGCFGDAIPLTPWQSFYKDMGLLGFILILIIGRQHIGSVFNEGLERIVLIVAVAACVAFPLYTYYKLPLIDFRDYAVGKNIPEQMKGVPDELKYMYVLKDKKTGKESEFDHWPEKWDSLYDYVTNRPIVIKKGIEPKIKDLSITKVSDGADYTEDVLLNPGHYFLLVMYDLDKASESSMGRINDLAALCQKDSIAFIALTASTADKVAAFKAKNNNTFEYYNTDGTVLKTMIRSNPGLMLLKGGTVLAHWPSGGIPSYDDVKNKYFKK